MLSLNFVISSDLMTDTKKQHGNSSTKACTDSVLGKNDCKRDFGRLSFNFSIIVQYPLFLRKEVDETMNHHMTNRVIMQFIFQVSVDNMQAVIATPK